MRYRRGLLGAAVVLLVTAVVLLSLWETPPAWLAGPRRFTAASLHWAHAHLLTVAVAGLVVSLAGLVVPFLIRRMDRRDTDDQQRRVRDREVMLARVRYRWVTGVLEQSLADQVRLRLALTRRPAAIQPSGTMMRRPGQKGEPLPPGTPVSVLFEELGGGLLILGGPGSGKTTALLELARDLLDRAEADERQPIPVVFNLSSWARHRPPLGQWLVDELHSRYSAPRSVGQQWLAAAELLPLLDGLDEVPADYRNECVRVINSFLREHGLARVAVCSRTSEYEALTVVLQLEEAVELQPPTRQEVLDYLAAAGSALTEVQAVLEDDETVWELLQSPLVLSIVALTYQDRPADALRATGTSAQRLAWLFGAYTERMLAHRAGYYSPVRMRRWLTWLARSMHVRSESEFHLDRLTRNWLPTTAQQRLAILLPVVSVGLFVGVVDGLAPAHGTSPALSVALSDALVIVLGFGLVKPAPSGEADSAWRSVRIGLIAALLIMLIYALTTYRPYFVRLVDGVLEGVFGGMLAGLFAWLSKTEPAEAVGWSWPSVRRGLRVGVFVGLLYGLVGGLVEVLIDGLQFALITAAYGIPLGLFAALSVGLVPRLVHERTRPNEGIHRSARHAVGIGLVLGLVSVLAYELVAWLLARVPLGLPFALAYGVFFAVTGGMVFGGLACMQHLAVRGLLAHHHWAPVNYPRFLEEATERLFLRRTGSGYIFVHRLLLEYLAEHEDSRRGGKALAS